MGWKAFLQSLIQTVVTSLVSAGAGKVIEKMGLSQYDKAK